MALHVPLAGSYSSALVRKLPLYPLATSTLPLGSNVAVCTSRALARLPVSLNVNGASTGESVRADAGPAIISSLSPATTGWMVALDPLVAGVALKLEASKTAEIDSSATERAIWSAQAPVELFCFC